MWTLIYKLILSISIIPSTTFWIKVVSSWASRIEIVHSLVFWEVVDPLLYVLLSEFVSNLTSYSTNEQALWHFISSKTTNTKNISLEKIISQILCCDLTIIHATTILMLTHNIFHNKSVLLFNPICIKPPRVAIRTNHKLPHDFSFGASLLVNINPLKITYCCIALCNC